MIIYFIFLYYVFIVPFSMFSYQTSMGVLLREINCSLELEQAKVVARDILVDDVVDVNITNTITNEIQEIEGETQGTVSDQSNDFKQSSKKEWLVAVYIAGQNNLGKFVGINLKSMADIGSCPNMHVIAQVDELGKEEITRVHVQKKKLQVLEEYEATEAYMSGTKESLYNFMAWGLEHFPAKKICLIIWNHGSGGIDPHMWDRSWFFDRDSDVFNFNIDTGLLELRPSVKMMHEFELNDSQRGVAFNEAQSVYLTNSDLTQVIESIQDDLLGGNKIDLVAFDACLMGMIEVACQINFSAKYMIASEEIVPGNGLPYNLILEALSKKVLTAEEFAVIITQAYAYEYEDTFADFTLSAIALEKIYPLKLAMNDVAASLLRLIASDYGEEILDMLYAIRVSRKMSTPFYNRDYIDINHTLQSIKDRVARFKKLEDILDEVLFLQKAIDEVQKILKESIINNVHGYNPVMASGLSMYWPRNTLHSSYQSSIFGKTTRWKHLLQKYLTVVK